MIEGKKAVESFTIMNELVLPNDTNTFGNLTIDAPSIAGNANKNAKSAATDLERPRNIPKLIETPKREIPAKSAVL